MTDKFKQLKRKIEAISISSSKQDWKWLEQMEISLLQEKLKRMLKTQIKIRKK